MHAWQIIKSMLLFLHIPKPNRYIGKNIYREKHQKNVKLASGLVYHTPVYTYNMTNNVAVKMMFSPQMLDNGTSISLFFLLLIQLSINKDI